MPLRVVSRTLRQKRAYSVEASISNVIYPFIRPFAVGQYLQNSMNEPLLGQDRTRLSRWPLSSLSRCSTLFLTATPEVLAWPEKSMLDSTISVSETPPHSLSEQRSKDQNLQIRNYKELLFSGTPLVGRHQTQLAPSYPLPGESGWSAQ